MKNIRSLLSASVLAVVCSTAALAATSLDRPSAPSTEQLVAAPTAIKVVHPNQLTQADDNVNVTVKFTLDTHGIPHNVASVGEISPDLANRLLPVIAKWQFTPCVDAKGNPVQRTVILPMTLKFDGI